MQMCIIQVGGQTPTLIHSTTTKKIIFLVSTETDKPNNQHKQQYSIFYIMLSFGCVLIHACCFLDLKVIFNLVQ